MNKWWIIAASTVTGSLLVNSLAAKDNQWEGVIDIVDDLPKHSSKVYKTRSKGQIKYLVVHHSAARNQSPFVVARFHVESKHLSATGAPGIAYHFYVLEDGTTYQTNYLDTVSWHIKNNNTASLGICLSGNFDHARPTNAQLNSLAKLVKTLKQVLPNSQVIGHRDLRPTSCPGQQFDISRFKRL